MVCLCVSWLAFLKTFKRIRDYLLMVTMDEKFDNEEKISPFVAE